MPGPIRQNGKIETFYNNCAEQPKEQPEMIEKLSCKCESHKEKWERPCLAIKNHFEGHYPWPTSLKG